MAYSGTMLAKVAITISLATEVVLTAIMDSSLFVVNLDSGTRFGIFVVFTCTNGSDWVIACSGPGCGPPDVRLKSSRLGTADATAQVQVSLAFMRAFHVVASVILLFAFCVVWFSFESKPGEPASSLAHSAWPFFLVAAAWWAALIAMIRYLSSLLARLLHLMHVRSIFLLLSTAKELGHPSGLGPGIAFSIVAFVAVFVGHPLPRRRADVFARSHGFLSARSPCSNTARRQDEPGRQLTDGREPGRAL
jgi:hypothetical protein